MSMKLKAPESLTSAERIRFYDCEENIKYYQYGTAGGWKKYEGNPVFGGGEYETCFDVSVLLEEDADGPLYKMWFSWRPKRSIGYTTSRDGINWSVPLCVLEPLPGSEFGPFQAVQAVPAALRLRHPAANPEASDGTGEAASAGSP